MLFPCFKVFGALSLVVGSALGITFAVRGMTNKEDDNHWILASLKTKTSNGDAASVELITETNKQNYSCQYKTSNSDSPVVDESCKIYKIESSTKSLSIQSLLSGTVEEKQKEQLTEHHHYLIKLDKKKVSAMTWSSGEEIVLISKTELKTDNKNQKTYATLTPHFSYLNSKATGKMSLALAKVVEKKSGSVTGSQTYKCKLNDIAECDVYEANVNSNNHKDFDVSSITTSNKISTHDDAKFAKDKYLLIDFKSSKKDLSLLKKSETIIYVLSGSNDVEIANLEIIYPVLGNIAHLDQLKKLI